MLFELRPKETLRDLFGRSKEYDELARLVRAGSWVCVLGKRMTGKTSLVKTFAKENEGVYVNLLGARGLGDLTTKLLAESGLKLEEIGVDLRLLQVRWTKVAEDAFSRLRDRIMVLDEVQEISSPNFLQILKGVWDTHRGLRLIFSGSYVGIMRQLIDPRSGSPLYGRNPAKLLLNTFTREAAREFLTKGFAQHKSIRVTQAEIERAVERLDGYVGWLAYYGNFRSIRKLPHDRALTETVKEGSKLLLGELHKFLQNRRRDLYMRVLRMTAMGATWSEMEEELGINSKVLRDILSSLTSAMMVEAKDGYYWIEDPILKETTRRLKLSAK